MFASRFWYLLLVILFGGSFASFYLAKDRYNRDRELDTKKLLVKDQIELQALLHTEARLMIDKLLPVVVDTTVMDVLSAATNSKTEISSTEKEKLRALLTKKNEELEQFKSDIIMAFDGKGRVVSYVWDELISVKEIGFKGLPVVHNALLGYMQDDFVVFHFAPNQFKLYRVVARPVINKGEYVGAIVYGQLIDRKFALRLSKNLESYILLFKDNFIYAQGVPEGKSPINEATFTQKLEQLLSGETKFLTSGVSELIELEDRDKKYATIYGLFPGEAKEQKSGYIIVREIPKVANAMDFIYGATKADWKELPWTFIGGGSFLLFILGIFWTVLEHTLPLRKFKKAIARILARENDRINIYAVSRQHRKLAEAINKVIDQVIEEIKERLTQQSIDVDSILSEVDESGRISQALFEPAFVAQSKSSISSPPPPPPPPKSSPQQAKVQSEPVKEDLSRYNSEDYYKEIFNQFIETKKQCGESIENLQFDRFLVTLNKNKELILKKFPDCKAVKFTVYIKDGKAAIKASPIL